MAEFVSDSAKMDAVDILKTYADFIRNDVRADDFERHPYLPHIEQTIEDLRAAPPAMKREAVEKDDPFSDGRWVYRALQPEFDKLSNGKPSEASSYRSTAMLHAANVIADAYRAHLSTLSADAIRQGEGATTRDFRAVPDGWRLVPLEPTREMIRAGMISRFNLAEQAERIWRDMLSATPASNASDGGKANG